jgi:hypothetical protein
MLSAILAASEARADTSAANACATRLPKDAKAIFDATLSQVAPGSDLRSLVTANTRSLAISGDIDRGSARQSATAAAKCLKLGG